MKKTFMLFCMFFVVNVFVFADMWENMDDYIKYKKARLEGIKFCEEGNTLNAVSNFLKAAEIAEKANLKYIQAHQLNRAAYCLITKYKVIKEINLLKEALIYLEKAKALNILEVEDIVNNNISFCKYYIKEVIE